MQWTEEKLNELLTRPSEALNDFMSKLDADIAIFGAGGKVGATIAEMASRSMAAVNCPHKIVAVSRFSNAEKKAEFEKLGVHTISADLGNDDDLKSLPDFKYIIFLAGRKFGTHGAESATWEANASVPTLVARRFKGASFVVFSTGNIYPLTTAVSGGCLETVQTSPVGEYAMSSVARERIFEYAARHYGSKVTLFRLNFAIDLRYGVLADIAKQIVNHEAVNLSIPNFNCIWQGYVAEVAIRSLANAASDPYIINVTGPEINSTKTVALKLAAYLDEPVRFSEEGEQSFLSDASLCMKTYGFPAYGIDQLIEWQAEWILAGGKDIGAPTHFEMSSGQF